VVELERVLRQSELPDVPCVRCHRECGLGLGLGPTTAPGKP
jgi:hypothetical protein